MRKPVTRALLILGGTVSLAVGIAGVFLPLLPATPFLLLASACYVRSSDRMHRWLMEHKHLGMYIRAFRERRGMPMRAKVVTLVLLWASMAYSIYRVDILAVRILLVVIAVGVTVLVLRMKTLVETDDSPS